MFSIFRIRVEEHENAKKSLHFQWKMHPYRRGLLFSMISRIRAVLERTVNFDID